MYAAYVMQKSHALILSNKTQNKKVSKVFTQLVFFGFLDFLLCCKD